MLFKRLCGYLAKIEKTSKRLEMMDIFQALFREGMNNDEGDIYDKIIYICQGKLYPDWLGRPELNMAKQKAIKAIARAIGLKTSSITKVNKKTGDLGKTINYLMKKKGKQSTLLEQRKDLTVLEVYRALEAIANFSGTDSDEKKVRGLTSLLLKCAPIEARYVARFIDSKMRLGVADLTMLESIARMLAPSEAEQAEYRSIIERAFNIHPDLGLVIKKALLEGIDSLEAMNPEIGIPIRSMLAQRLESSADFLEKHGGPFAAEYKLDGERMQIHKNGDDVTLFSRRQEIITPQFPDVVEYIKKFIKAKGIIADGEVVAINPETKKLDKFQVLMQRRRKYGIEEKVEEIPTRVYLFDVMLHEGQSTLDLPYLKRRALIEASITRSPAQDKLVPVPQKIIHSHEELINYFNQAIDDGTEGLLTKSIRDDSVYQPGARGWLWIKLKSLSRGKLSDSMDLVIIGANMGEGRRSGYYGTLLLAALNEGTGKFEMVTKTASGMTDETAEYFFKNLKPLESQLKGVVSNEVPDQWVEPEIVVEIAGDEITDSSQSAIGVSIRFPRILRIRDDKAIEDITKVKEILNMRNEN